MPPRRDRLASRRQVVGLSQEGLAEAVGVDRSTIVRWERGETNPLAAYRPRLAKALNVSLEELAVLLDNSGVLDAVPPCARGTQPHEPYAPGASMRLRPTAVARGGARQRGEIDTGLAQALLDVSGRYRHAYQAVPASTLLPAVLAHYDLVMSLQPAWRPREQCQQLLTAGAEMAALAGVLLGLDAGRHTEAVSWLDTAWAAARAAGSVELEAVVLGCLSFVFANGYGDHRGGLEYADFARHVATRGASARTRGWVAAIASERCASLGDGHGCMTRLDESRQALDGGDATDVPWRGIGSYDDDKLRAYEGGDLVRLRRYREAEESLDAALATLRPGMARHRATALLDRADARLGAGDVDAACDDATMALNLVAQVEHTGHIGRIEGFAARARDADTRVARDLHEQVMLIRVDFGLSPGKEAT